MRTCLFLGLLLTCSGIGAGSAAQAQTTAEQLAAQARDILRKHCFDCHGKNPKKLSDGLNLFDPSHLADKERKVVVARAPDESALLQQIEKELMPPGKRPPVPAEERKLLREWIAAGAAPFPALADAGRTEGDRPAQGGDSPVEGQPVPGANRDEEVVKKILAHVRNVPLADRRFLRYFSLHHLLAAGATPADLELQRDALAKAINHLTQAGKIVQPRPVTPDGTLFVIDLRRLGWHQQPFERIKDGKSVEKSKLTLFDLVLLEYPYGIVSADSETTDRLVEEFLQPAEQVRPIPYIRADWFVSTATQPPLYEDLLQLPFDLSELETQLGVPSGDNVKARLAVRAGMVRSNVSRNNRVVERHPLPRSRGAYWKSFDFRSSKGLENIIKDPIDLHPTGGEYIFTLPNGLQGYFISDARGNRLEAAPTDIVTDRFAEDKTVRNGLACMRCHDAGMRGFTDAVRPALLSLPGQPDFDKQAALELYPGDEPMQKLLAEDSERFRKAMKEVLGKDQTREPLIPVSQRFLDRPLTLKSVAGELGLGQPAGLEAVFKLPQFSALGLAPLAAGGEVRRDSWEESYDQVVRYLGLGTVLPPLDGAVRRDYPAGPAFFEVELTTNKKSNLFQPGDRAFLFVANKSPRPLFIELIGTDARGRKVILTSNPTRVEPGTTFQFPSKGEEGILIQPQLGKEQITLFARDTEFPAGELLRGQGVTDRVVHPFFGFQPRAGRMKVTGDLARLLKKTIEIETH